MPSALNNELDVLNMTEKSPSLLGCTCCIPQTPAPPGLLHTTVPSEPLRSTGKTLPVRIIVEV